MRVHTVTVVGAGTMGRGVAHVAMTGGFATVLQDVSREQLEKARASIAQNLEKGVERGKLSKSEADAALLRLSLETSLEKAGAIADFVVEAVPEIIGLKLDIFATLDRVTADHVTLATNTSALSITEIAASTRRPQRVIGMHFFNPVHVMKLIEIVRGLQTDDAAFAATEAVAGRMGKETVAVNESPGFVTSRVNALIGNEAFYMLESGVASARDIDKALKLGLNHPMGPFELVDLVGLDTRLSILRYLQQTLGEKYRPCPLLEKYVKAGRLGKKAGRGVYDYPLDL